MMEAKKSIVLVTVDCLRADHVGFMGYPQPTTPFLDSLAAKSFVFPAAIVGGVPTFYSLPAMLASRYPLALGRDVVGLAPDELSLASVLKKAGYATASFGAGNPYISARFGYEQGFDTFRNFLDDASAAFADEGADSSAGTGWVSRLNRNLQNARSSMGPLRILYDELYFQYCQRKAPADFSLDALRRFPAADVVVDQACQWLASVKEPFFLWLHLMDPHAPYYPTEKALELMGHAPVLPFRARYLNSFWNRSDLGPRRLARHRDEIVALYDAGIRWADAQIARLIGKLQTADCWENCAFAFTADHGEEFLDHGGRFHSASRLTEELIHVPLLLRVPGTARTVAGKSPFSLLHLAPTLLDAARLPVPSEFRGRSYWNELLRGEAFGSVAISENVANCKNPYNRQDRFGSRALSIRESRYKLLLAFDPPAERLYDLEADPGEQAPLAPTAQKAVRRRLLEIAREHLRSSKQRDERARLRARLHELPLEWARSFPHRAEA